MGVSGGAAACAGEKGLGVPCGDTRRAAAAESFPMRSGKPPERDWKKATETGLGKSREAGLGKSGRGGNGAAQPPERNGKNWQSRCRQI